MTETPNERAPQDRLLVLAGPTASGKTRVALALAERFPIEVISADSVQVYRGFDIGSAKPTASERAQLPHHLVDILAPEDGMDAGEFERRAGHPDAQHRHERPRRAEPPVAPRRHQLHAPPDAAFP